MRNASSQALSLQDVGCSSDGSPPSSVQLGAPLLPLLRLELTFTIEEPVLLPPFRGGMWRGVLGPALKRIDDGFLPEVSTGALERGTLYSTFFETPPPPDAAKMRLYNAVPHPYVVDAPGQPGFRRIAPGEEERIGVTLVGRAATAVEAVLAAFDVAARSGFGAPPTQGVGARRGRGRLSLARAVWRGPAQEPVVVYDGAAFRGASAVVPPCPAPARRMRVFLNTPLRLVQQERLIGPTTFRPAALISNLVRRVSMMTAFHGDTPLDTDFGYLKRLWEGLQAEEQSLAFADQKRWSGSQQRELDMGGIVGSFVLNLRGAEALFPYLWLGQWLHAGKGAVMGMGAIRLRPEV
jgi:hypothetical protein